MKKNMKKKRKAVIRLLGANINTMLTKAPRLLVGAIRKNIKDMCDKLYSEYDNILVNAAGPGFVCNPMIIKPCSWPICQPVNALFTRQNMDSSRKYIDDSVDDFLPGNPDDFTAVDDLIIKHTTVIGLKKESHKSFINFLSILKQLDFGILARRRQFRYCCIAKTNANTRRSKNRKNNQRRKRKKVIKLKAKYKTG